MSLIFHDGVNTLNNLKVREDEGFALYTYLDVHLDRVYGGSNIGNPDVFIRNGELLLKKKSLVQKILLVYFGRSETLKYFNISFSYPGTESFYKRFADIINYSAQKYWEFKPEGDFYVGFYPGFFAKETAWTKYLDKKIKVLYIDSPPDYETNLEDYVIHPKVDRHPSKKLNTYYVNQIMNLIN